MTNRERQHAAKTHARIHALASRAMQLQKADTVDEQQMRGKEMQAREIVVLRGAARTVSKSSVWRSFIAATLYSVLSFFHCFTESGWSIPNALTRCARLYRTTDKTAGKQAGR